MTIRWEGERPRGPWWRVLLRLAFVLAFVLGVAGGATGLGAYHHFAAEVPDFDALEDYRPAIITRIYGQTGRVVGELYRERREPLPYDRIPPRLVEAFLASEDARFFEHGGIDPWGILRAAFANLRAGRVVQGGSTITQQVAKSLLISEEGYASGSARKLSRKIREAILARRLEQRLSKDDIIALYLNQIFLGNQAYGVQSAAQAYFRKSVGELNLAEMALLGGLPQAPSRYSPFRHPKVARERRRYVLRRMVEEGFISEAELEDAEATPIRVFRAPNRFREVAPFFTEHVRRLLSERYDEDTLLTQGLSVFTTVDVERYRGAENAVYDKLRLVDKRQGFRGPLLRLPSASEQAHFLERYEAELRARGLEGPLEMDALYLGLIAGIDRKRGHVRVRIGSHPALLPVAGMRWARPVDPQVRYDSALLDRVPSSLAVGDVVHVRVTDAERLRATAAGTPSVRSIPRRPKLPLVRLEQEPTLEVALLSQSVETGYVLAMVGGYAFERSEFNRALQACRQPGSAFKPVVYSAALEVAEMTPSSIILDAPLAFNDAQAQNRWKPNNFAGTFKGEVTLRTALMNSMNVPAIRILDRVGVGRAIRYAKKLGITSELRPELGLALGSSCVTMGELLGVYATIAGGGQKTPRRFITRIEDRDGRVLFDDGHPSDPWASFDTKLKRALAVTRTPSERVMDRDVAFVMTKLMQNVVEHGTGQAAKRVGVPVAGKTGTTNDSFDAWFVGFTPEIATAAWVGFDDYVLPMGRYEQGGRAALPVWVDYMKRAIKEPTEDFEPPPGVVFVSIDPETGQRAPEDRADAVLEAYVRGTEPEEFAAGEGEAQPDAFFMLDN
jgi:penicillin-binding protein 1A